MFFDSHLHILLIQEKHKSLEEVIERALDKNVTHLIDVSVGLDDFFKRIFVSTKLMERYGIKIYNSAGIPPFFADKRTKDDIKKLEEQINNNKVIAIGEIGLDFYYNYGTPQQQVDLFISQIELANKNKLPIIVHTRDADKILLETLESHRAEYGGIIHCFSSNYETAKRLIDLGFFISFAGNLTYKKSFDIQDAAKRIPLENILLETDSPYLSPNNFRGKPNEPAFIVETAKYLAQLRGISVEFLADVTFRNTKTVYKID